MFTSPELQRFFDSNKAWADAVTGKNSNFFPQSAENQQSPSILWIGCADSRVPESVLLAVKPGEVFVHRNIANQFHVNDDSALSVLFFAIRSLLVKHVVVVGHTQCGGVKGVLEAIQNPDPNAADKPLGRWLTPLANLAVSQNLPSADMEASVSQLVRESVKAQVANVAASEVMKSAWADGFEVSIHGWLYHLETGRLEDLGLDVSPPSKA